MAFIINLCFRRIVICLVLRIAGLARLSDGIVFPLLQRELDAIRTLGTLVVVTAQEAGVVLAPAGADAHPVEWRSGGRAHSDRSY